MDRLQPWAGDLTHRSAKKRCHAALRLEELARQGQDLSPLLDRLLQATGDGNTLVRRWARLAVRAAARHGLDLTAALPLLCARLESHPDFADCLLEYARQNPLWAGRVLQQLGQPHNRGPLFQDLQLLARRPLPRRHWRWEGGEVDTLGGCLCWVGWQGQRREQSFTDLLDHGPPTDLLLDLGPADIPLTVLSQLHTTLGAIPLAGTELQHQLDGRRWHREFLVQYYQELEAAADPDD